SGKNGRVDLFGEFSLAEDNSAARAAQTFVGSGGDKLRMRNGTRMLSAGNETANVRHVDEEERADGVGDLAHPGKIDDPRLSGRAGGDHCRPNFFGLFLQRVVIDLLRLFAPAILRDRVKLAGAVCWIAASA